MALADPALDELANLFGVATEFWDWKGRHTQISDETVIAILAAMSVDASSPEKVSAAVKEALVRPWRRALPPVVVMCQNQVGHVKVHVADGTPVNLSIRLEDGEVRHDIHQVDDWSDPRLVDGVLTCEISFEIAANLPLGYHRIVLASDEFEAESLLIVTPDFLGMPARVGNRRLWGYATQLYSVRSETSWGVGDLSDLGDLVTWSATQQYAGYVLINPLHAAQPEPPMESSPYLPSTRRYVNPLYLRPEAIAEYAGLSSADRAEIERLRRSVVDDPRALARIRRDDAWTAKRAALKIIYAAGLRPIRRMAFDAYRRGEGRALTDFATWWVACGVFGNDWRTWDEPYQRPSSPEMADFRAQYADEIDFAEWLQWIAQTQLSDTGRKAKEAGMQIGVVADLAVGVSKSGAETWMMPDLFAHGVSVGAPPDDYNQIGQDWGQPPWRPDRLADLGYAPFRMMVRNALANAGGIRIDHILGMFRLWWIPEGLSAKEGAYVHYDHEALVGIIALEAKRADAVVIGEDLGTVEPWVREYLAKRGILGTSVIWFECGDGFAPLPAEKWREYAMASVTTHDLPPTAGFLALDHVRLRHELGLLTEPFEDELAKAIEEQHSYLNFLRERGFLSVPPQVDLNDPKLPDSEVEAQVLALHRFLRATPSRLMNVALVDAIGDRRTQNQPGTVDEYPNWRIPLSDPTGEPILLENIYESDSALRLASVMNGFSTVPGLWTVER